MFIPSIYVWVMHVEGSKKKKHHYPSVLMFLKIYILVNKRLTQERIILNVNIIENAKRRKIITNICLRTEFWQTTILRSFMKDENSKVI